MSGDSLWTSVKRRFMRPVADADATGDRRAEAKAHLEASTGVDPKETSTTSEQQAVGEQRRDARPEN
jgi:hypothetical protein